MPRVNPQECEDPVQIAEMVKEAVEQTSQIIEKNRRYPSPQELATMAAAPDSVQDVLGRMKPDEQEKVASVPNFIQECVDRLRVLPMDEKQAMQTAHILVKTRNSCPFQIEALQDAHEVPLARFPDVDFGRWYICAEMGIPTDSTDEQIEEAREAETRRLLGNVADEIMGTSKSVIVDQS